VQRYGPELEQRLRRHLKPTNKSWRVDETYVRVQGRWCYLYRAIDSAGATIDFLLSALRDADAAKRLFRKALSDRSHPQPRVINTDLAPIYSAAIADIKKEGALRRRCRHRPVQYLNNILEQDHRAIKSGIAKAAMNIVKSVFIFPPGVLAGIRGPCGIFRGLCSGADLVGRPRPLPHRPENSVGRRKTSFLPSVHLACRF